MEQYTAPLTTAQIRKMDIHEEDVLGYDYQWIDDVDHNFLTINGERVASFTTTRARQASYRKIRKMDLGLGWQPRQLSDEEKGIVAAAEMGENPFEYSILSR